MISHAEWGDWPAGQRPRTLLLCLLLVGAAIALAGCGSRGLSQADMRKYAIKRGGDNSDAPQKPAPGPGKPPGNNAAQTAATKASEPPPPKQSAPAPPPPSIAAQPAQTVPASPVQDVTDTPATPVASADQDGTLPATGGNDDPQTSPPESPPATAGRPAEPLSLVQRRERTIANLKQIGSAVQRYCEQNGHIFMAAINDPKGNPLLSWRVELLPYLGRKDLYDKFHLDEPWDSLHNKPLLAEIPEVYQSPERFDEKTNYLVPRASFSAFNRPRGLGMMNFEDGPDDTVVVLEVDDAAAVPWTRPADLEIDLQDFRKSLGNLRGDGFFVVWANGALTRVSPECTMKDFKAIVSFDGGEPFTSAAVRCEATASPAAVASQGPGTTSAEGLPAASNRGEEVARSSREMKPAARGPQNRAGRATSSADRWPVPDPISLEQARKLVREVYHEDYEKSKSPREQQALAQRMLKEAARMQEDPAGQYVMYDIALKISTQIGDTATAFSVIKELLKHFEVDELATKYDALVALAKKDRSQAGVRILSDESSTLIETALKSDQYDIAESLCELALRAVRQLGDRGRQSDLEQQAEFIQEARKTYGKVRQTLATLSDSDDPDANLHVGSYYCFVKGEWDKGLPLLAKGSNVRLRELAAGELRAPSLPVEQLELADGWWELGEQDPPHQKALRLRAAYWYASAVKGLPKGLWRAKAEMRMDEVKREYGPAALAVADKRPAG